MRTTATMVVARRTLYLHRGSPTKGTIVISKAVGRSLAACAIVFPAALGVAVPAAQAKNGDTHITGQGIEQTIDCNESTLLVNGTGNTIYALGSCWAVTVQGSSNVVVADNIVDNVIVYGNDQTVFYKNGEPVVWDRGRELGMTNRIDRVPA
jgi:Ca2+-binding RTX toxin-like protein